MPIYEYDCPKCGEFEVTQRITEPSLERCPTCRSKIRKLISQTSFQLKGEGWYVTDYARKGKKSDTGSATEKKGAASETSSSESASSESATPSTSKDGKAAA